MARTLLVETPDGIIATGKVLFAKHKAEGDKSPLRVLTDYDYIALEKEYDTYVFLETEARNHDKLAKQLREKRDNIWKEKLKNPYMQAKDLVLSINKNNVTAMEDWGYKTIKNPTKKSTAKGSKKAGKTDDNIQTDVTTEETTANA